MHRSPTPPSSPAPEPPDASPPESKSSWPYASLLLVGTFNLQTPAEWRLCIRSAASLVAIAVALLTLGLGVDSPVVRYLVALVIPGAVAAIGREHAVYFRSLDELSRTIQLEAAAFAYGAAMFLGFAWVGWMIAYGGSDPRIAGIGLLICLVVAEPLRGIALVRVARKYE